jgi:hypothetical protein
VRIPYVTQRNKYKGFPMIDQSVNSTGSQSLWEAASKEDDFWHPLFTLAGSDPDYARAMNWEYAHQRYGKDLSETLINEFRDYAPVYSPISYLPCDPQTGRGRDFARGITGGWAEPTSWNLRNIEEIGAQNYYDSLALVLFKSLPGDAKKFL